MHPHLQSIAIVAYVCAMGLALTHLVQRQPLVHRLAALSTLIGWVAHTLALIVLAIEVGRPPLGTLANAVSVVVWVVVLLEMLVERQSGVTVLGAFVLPVVVVLSLKSSVARPVTLALGNAWIWIHIALALVGIAAFVLNFAGAIMYLLHERQIRHKRPGRFYHRLPPLETLDRWTYRTLALGFPFLTTGLILGAVWARTAWGSVFAFDPLAFFSLVAWLIYAGTLAGRAAGGWHGRLPPPVPAARRGGDGRRGGPLHARRGRRDPPRLSRGLEPRLDDDRRAADPRPGQGRLRARAGLRGGGAGAAHALHPGLCRRQARAHGDGDRAPRRLDLVRRRRAGQEDLRAARRPRRAAGGRRQDERAGGQAPRGTGSVPDLRRESHVGARPGDGARAVGHRGAVRGAGDGAGRGGHRDHLHGGAGARRDARRRRPRRPEPRHPSALLHRHRGAARRRAGRRGAWLGAGGRARAVRVGAALVIRLATRGSALALAQARVVADRLEAGGLRVEIIAMRTEGDRRAEARLAAIGGKGLFVREIEDALLRGDADVAVHSLKDLPADLPRGLILAVFPEREDPRDVVVTREAGGLETLPRGAMR